MRNARYVAMRGDQILSDHRTYEEAEEARRRAYGDRVAIAHDCVGCAALTPIDCRCSCLNY